MTINKKEDYEEVRSLYAEEIRVASLTCDRCLRMERLV